MTSRTLRISATVAALATAVSLAACSSDSGDSDGTGSTDAASSATASDAFPVSVDTKFGDVEVKEQPKKVVALGWGDAELAMDLGVQPVGVSDWLDFGDDGLSPWSTDTYDQAPEQLGTQEIDYEKIAALEPDLILDTRSKGDKETYEKLSAIAPTISGPEGSDNWLTPWDKQTDMVATALGEKEKGQELADKVNDKVASVRDAHPEWADMDASVITKTTTEWGAYVAGDARVDLIDSLGFTQNTTIEDQAKDTFYVSLSDETLDQADSDVVLSFPIGLTTDDIRNDRAWSNLAAVKAGHGIIAEKELSTAISLGVPSAMLHALDLLVPQLEDATK